MFIVDNQKVINRDVLQLADDLPCFNEYLWGVFIWNLTIEPLSKAIGPCYDEVVQMHAKRWNVIPLIKYILMGFSLDFQV